MKHDFYPGGNDQGVFGKETDICIFPEHLQGQPANHHAKIFDGQIGFEKIAFPAGWH